MINQLFDHLSSTLHRSLDVRMRRHVVLSGNLANADTPNYIPIDVDFKDTLKAVSEGKEGLEVPSVVLHYDPTSTPGPDGNAVDLDREMVRMTTNDLQYSVSTRILDKRLALLKYAIMEGRGL